jgi:apolipoprotein N-acyltransferase
MDSATATLGHTDSFASRVGDFFRSLRGWRRYGTALALGLVSALAFAPFNAFPLLLLAFAALILLVDGTRGQSRAVWRAAAIGWTFGFGNFLAGLYWVGYAFTVDASEHAWQIPFVAALLPGYLAIFPALACATMAAFGRQDSSRIFLFAAAYGAAEWLRGHLLTGFPWNLPAYAWGAAPGILQSAALFGSYALSLLTVLLGASLARFCDCDSGRWKLPAFTIALFALLWIGGEIRLAVVHPGDVAGVRLRLVQPNVPQREKMERRLWSRNWQSLIDLSRTKATSPPTIIVWPEAAPPYIFVRMPSAMGEIATLTGTNHVLMTGAARRLRTPDDNIQAFNSLYIFGPQGVLLATYDKFHLVPFGEYLPLSGFLGALGIDKLVDSPGGFSSGTGPQTYSVPGAPAVGPLICYEILFPGEVVGRTRPGWIVNVTDDSWFGPSTGPYQHLTTARVRAIEEGLPVARAANTGISAVIDPLGRVRKSLGLDQMGVVDSALPAAISAPPYTKLGEIGFVLMLITCFWGGLSGRFTPALSILGNLFESR